MNEEIVTSANKKRKRVGKGRSLDYILRNDLIALISFSQYFYVSSVCLYVTMCGFRTRGDDDEQDFSPAAMAICALAID